MHDCNGFLKYTVIYYHHVNESCYDKDNFINTYHKLSFNPNYYTAIIKAHTGMNSLTEV